MTALVMLAIFATLSLIAIGLPPAARLMPLMVGIPGALLALIELVMEYRRIAAAAPPKDDERAEQAKEKRAEIQMFKWTFLFFVGFLLFGFLIAAPLLVFAFLFIGKKESLSVALISAVSVLAILYGFFETWLEIQLFSGLVIDWLGF